MRLDDFITLQRGFDLTRINMNDGIYPVVGSTSIIGYHHEFKADAPGVVIGRSGSLGTVQYVKDPYWPHNTSLWVKDFKGNDPRYVYFKLIGLDFSRFNAGAGVPTLNRNHLSTIEIDVPVLHVQKKIASILSAYDDLIENNTRRIQILEEMARRLYREWFVEFRFPGHEKVKMVDSGTELGMVPEGWEVKKVVECVDFNPRVSVPRDGEKAFVPMGCLSTDSIIITDVESRTGNSGAKFQNRDTLLARITPCLENGKTGFVQFLPDEKAVAFGSTEYIVMRSHSLTPEYVYLLARSDEFRKHAIKSMTGASGRQRVQESCFNQYLLSQPPVICLDRFSKLVRPMFDLIQKLHLQSQNFRITRNLLLPRLMSGEVSVKLL